jgi:hypothetical protein
LPLSREPAKQLEDAARSQHRHATELLEEAVKQYLEDRSWARLMEYGQERAHAVVPRGGTMRRSAGGTGLRRG